MNGKQKISFNNQVYYRLIALWVLCEGFLGGIIHGLKIPVSGLIVGSGAIICICFIAYYVPLKGAIIKATIIVAIFKMMLSPHSPPAAYFAVLFQGFVGQLLFINLRFFKLSCILLGLLAMVESAVQRVLVLIILYGTQVWNAVDQFIIRLTNETEVTNYSFLIASGYIALHAVAGLYVGWFASQLVLKSKQWKNEPKLIIDDLDASDKTIQSKPPFFKKQVNTHIIFDYLAFVNPIISTIVF